MATNRRLWLKEISLGIGAIGLANFKAIASPGKQEFFENIPDGLSPVLLSSNENPYGPSPLARKAFTDNMTISNRYNWDIASQLISAIAEKNRVKDENILLGAGSTEILDLVARYAASEKGNYIIADPSYNYWTVVLDNLGSEKIKVPLTTDKKLDLKAMLNSITQDTKLVYICNPNNPTGTICERELLREFITRVSPKTIILVDEAYLDFTKQSSLSNLVNDYSNLVIAKTFSKIYGLAGARIGYAIASKTMIDNLSKLQSSPDGSNSVLSRLAAMASLKDDKFVLECYSLNETVKKYTIEELKKLNLTCIPSNTNFIYFSLSNYKKDYFQQLKNNNIEGTKIYEEQGKWTRITVGTIEEMKKFIKAIQ
jgi:histidinol-phosphate aminotransferase